MPAKELSDRFCQSAKPKDGAKIDWFDTTVRGLCFRVSPAGTRAFFLVYTQPGARKRVWMKIGTYPQLSLAAARQKARDTRASIGEGSDPAAEKRAQEAAQTVSDLIESYLKRQVSKNRTAAESARRLRRNVVPIIGHVRLPQLHKRDITRAIDSIVDRGALIEANRTFAELRAMVRWATARGDLDANIADGMQQPAPNVVRERTLTVDEIRDLWHALPNAAMTESLRRVIRLLLVSGQRVGEVTGMERGELDLERGLWVIPASRSKNGRQHEVPLSAMAVQIIRQQISDVDQLAERMGREPSSFVFPAPGGRAGMTNAAVSKSVLRNRHLAIAPWRPHDLRRTAASMMAEAGVSPFIIAHVLNHASITKGSVTQAVYNRYSYAKEMREALTLWADRLAGIVGGGAQVLPLTTARNSPKTTG